MTRDHTPFHILERSPFRNSSDYGWIREYELLIYSSKLELSSLSQISKLDFGLLTDEDSVNRLRAAWHKCMWEIQSYMVDMAQRSFQFRGEQDWTRTGPGPILPEAALGYT